MDFADSNIELFVACDAACNLTSCEEQAAALRNLSDVLNEARFKFTRQNKQELAEKNKLLQAQIDAWGLSLKPLEAPFQSRNQKHQCERVSYHDKQDNRKSHAPLPHHYGQNGAEQNSFLCPEIGHVKVKVEVLRHKYGPPQCFRCHGFFHSSKFCTRAPRCIKCAGEHLAKDCVKPIDQKPKCCLCEEEHPANFLGCPKNPKNKVEKTKNTNNGTIQSTKVVDNTPAPPKVNFWEQRAKNITQRQQTNPSTSKKSSQATSSTVYNTESASDIFDQLNSPAVRETFDLLEEFIQITTTIPIRYGRLRAIKKPARRRS
ncbi:uncharacterized protein TNIN_4071 [Trichonephila inaurata madagascariensis]|uniref:Gag-like protein n=1 Tax=Trichonephila inaurata madagascariensis TaxID=2747483 RepID=A0A8X6XXA7_9ARAC|nr:uncharacterized protein TNIN_4071 [Trichonephila inaurata madagascariensis]